MTIRGAQILAFQPSGSGPRSVSTAAPEPGRSGPDAFPDREWGLSAKQVVAIVAVIVGACELLGVLL